VPSSPLRNKRPRRGFAIVLLAFLLLTGCAVGAAEPEPAAQPLGSWERVAAGGATKCARGDPYAFWIRRGDPKRLVIFFQGGGGCFDETTCAEGSGWFDDRVDAEDDPAYAGGMLSLDDPQNPFRNWSFVYIPSCSGDVHTGDARVDYGSVVVEQRGWQNARTALARGFRDFQAPSQVIVTGCSAGSVGSAWHAEAVIRRYRNAHVTQVGDSLAFVYHRPIRLTDWGTNKHFPSFFGVGGRGWTMEEFVTRLARAYPAVTFARFNHANDEVQERFYEAVGGSAPDFAPKLRTVERRLKRLPNYRSYLACGTEHCAFQTFEFSTLAVDGVRLRDWVHDLAQGRDVDCPECRG
jgi:Pectinacetylesterase